MATVNEVVAQLKKLGRPENVAGMARYGITAKKVLGVSVNQLHQVAKQVGRDHRLALGLWKTGYYEARMLACFVDEPAEVTPAQMDSWRRDFDNWAICDTACMHLFDRTPHAWKKAAKWVTHRGEMQKRAGFALLASLAAHDRTATEAQLIGALPLIAAGASDERNFVKKGVSWALRGIGHRTVKTHQAAIALAKTFAASQVPAERWVGKDALRDLQRPQVRAKVEKRARAR